eukprot:m.238601 g.238601  ORF g.238601 m.238601 type:complete len:134 (-) comp54359_c0_seq6:48-449(-)
MYRWMNSLSLAAIQYEKTTEEREEEEKFDHERELFKRSKNDDANSDGSNDDSRLSRNSIGGRSAPPGDTSSVYSDHSASAMSVPDTAMSWDLRTREIVGRFHPKPSPTKPAGVHEARVPVRALANKAQTGTMC